jgi:hypothetical protein
VARGQQRVDEHRLQLGLLLDRRAEQEDPVEAAQDLGRRRVVEGRHHVLRRPRQVGGLGLDPHHGRDVGVRVGQRLHQVVSDPPSRSGHQYHAVHPIAPESSGGMCRSQAVSSPLARRSAWITGRPLPRVASRRIECQYTPHDGCTVTQSSRWHPVRHGVLVWPR